MFSNTPFEAIAKSFTANVPHFELGSALEVFKPLQDNLLAWTDLAQSQVAGIQAVVVEYFGVINGARDPQTAFEIYTAASEAALTLFQKNLKDTVALSVSQFHDMVDAVQKSHPSGELFAPFALCLKAAATSAETVVSASIEKGTSVAASVTPVSKTKRATK